MDTFRDGYGEAEDYRQQNISTWRLNELLQYEKDNQLLRAEIAELRAQTMRAAQPEEKPIVRWKLEYDGPPNDRYARHVEDPNGGWVAWPHVEKLLASQPEGWQPMATALEALERRMRNQTRLWRSAGNPEGFSVMVDHFADEIRRLHHETETMSAMRESELQGTRARERRQELDALPAAPPGAPGEQKE
jgi:hypothetical protein